MTSVTLKNIGKTYAGGIKVIENLNLNIRAGEFMVFVGPSGCGKTTLMRMIAGLEEITTGELLFGNELMNDVGPAERGSAMVFQSYALYPHMSVAQNMAFGLKMGGASQAEQNAAVMQVAEKLQITKLLDRKPKALSGGQRQRVAIGRAIVRKPSVFLFDEPLSNLDANLRVQMRIELSRLHQELGTTMIYVTHDQVEAMTLGQRIAVFNGGRIEQVGTPLDLYHQPATLFVAEFMGSPKMNIVAARFDRAPDGSPRAAVLQAGSWPLPNGWNHLESIHTIGVRPEDLQLVPEGSGVAAQVSLVEHLGDSTIVYARIKGHDKDMALRLNGSVHGIAIGQGVGLTCPSSQVRCFNSAGDALT